MCNPTQVEKIIHPHLYSSTICTLGSAIINIEWVYIQILSVTHMYVFLQTVEDSSDTASTAAEIVDDSPQVQVAMFEDSYIIGLPSNALHWRYRSPK